MRRKIFVFVVISTCFFLSACQKEEIHDNLDYQTLGTSANDLLSGGSYSRLEIEINFMPGNAPDPESMSNLVDFLKTYINKPGGINIYAREIPSENKPVLSISDIVRIEKKYRTNFSAYHVIGVQVLITDGEYYKPDIFATSYWNTSFCIFGKSLNDFSGNPGQIKRTTLLTTLLQHEFGHLLGLVNQGSPMQSNHVDPANPAHCTNPDCLMYFQIESSNSAGNTNSLPTLDANCIADLKANGGK
ncbi:MAG: hypothetical protein Q7T76_02915 [Ferruginibacter sp.]|nr:hypothetical protein [Ferruginibacter sp.]